MSETTDLRALAERATLIETLSRDSARELTDAVQRHVRGLLPDRLLGPTTGPCPGYGATLAGPTGTRHGVHCAVHLHGDGKLSYDVAADTWSWSWPSPTGHVSGLASPEEAIGGLVIHLLTSGSPAYAATLMRHCRLSLIVVPHE